MVLSSLVVAYSEEMYSIQDPLTKIPKNTELRGFQVTQKLGFRVLFEKPWSYMWEGANVTWAKRNREGQ